MFTMVVEAPFRARQKLIKNNEREKIGWVLSCDLAVFLLSHPPSHALPKSLEKSLLSSLKSQNPHSHIFKNLTE
ncbi:hypothetical protein L1887_03241 [Cichorium endivia]|nr:hypothetical protein L1887_03241 [Cichorium endivia]